MAYYNSDNTLYNDGFYWIKECLHCNERYSAKREDSRYCSPACRKRAQRAEKKRVENREKLIELINSVIGERETIEDIEALVHAHARLSGFLVVNGFANVSAQYTVEFPKQEKLL